ELGRARAEKIEETAEGREVTPRQRPAPASEAQALEEHAPENRLLECHGLEPPRRDGSKTAHAGREAAEERPPNHVEEDLDQVERVDAERRAVALQRPGPADHAALLGERLLRPLERIVGRRKRIEEAHGASATRL